MKFAAIDIGSNAIRLLITNVFEETGKPIFKKASLVRVPIRLGADAFTEGVISGTKGRKMADSIQAFKLLMDVHDVQSWRACATSAMREATNGQMLADEIYDSTGINIEIITGKQEADIIFANHFEEQMDVDANYLYIDVGGGSTELTLFSDRKVVDSASFKLGTIRIMNNKVNQRTWDSARDWVTSRCKGLKPITALGSGGNINKLYKMAEIPGRLPMRLKKLGAIRETLNSMSYEERIIKLGLNLDRADVIIPACDIFLSITEWAGIKKISVPEFGLSDGITRLLYEQYQASKQD